MPGSKNISFCLDGEPLLNKDFHDFVYLACRYGLFPRFSSNGRLLDEKKANELAAAGNFLASIDFASEVRYFENIRGTKEDYYAILENLQYLVNVAKRNKKIKLEIVDISSFAGTDPDKSLKNMRKLFPEKLPKNIMFFYRRFHNFCGHLSFKKRGYKLCPYPWTSFNITWKGDAVICCRDTEARTVLGNVFTDPILDIWYGDKYLDARRNLFNKQPHKNEACKNCDLPWSGGTKRWDPGYVVSSLLRR
jgi:radical SAM protein with 4Fe4S-binding SPASM domain